MPDTLYDALARLDDGGPVTTDLAVQLVAALARDAPAEREAPPSSQQHAPGQAHGEPGAILVFVPGLCAPRPPSPSRRL